ncbi:MAG: ABC transporter ATP-binding protein [Euzebyales bacterium]|nr:ABC transporter ATP-binding protein [Euzebyales bacterium]
MPGNAIEVEQLGKRYRLGEYQATGSLRDAVAGALRRLGRGRRPADELWSLRDVSFTVEQGHAVGVIGRNGAGKSTLLKILSRITEPTTGVTRTRGRLAALLEVGTGFHAELTGRENVILNGAILGMSRRDIARRFDEIVSFAGVERFVDTPVKRYSSGMYLRLAFSVAAHLEPDILVVDEVLAVGDAEFQAKCLRRMETAEREGRTVVFVSHNLDAISRLCAETIWLEQGSIADLGATAQVVDAYLAAQVQRSSQERFDDAGGPVALRSVLVTDADGVPLQVSRRDRPFVIEVRFEVRTAVPGLDIAAYVLNMRGVEVLNEAWSDTEPDRPNASGQYIARLRIPPVLTGGEYVVGVWIGTAYETLVQEVTAQQIRLEGDLKAKKRVVDLGLPWQVERASDPAKRRLVMGEHD